MQTSTVKRIRQRTTENLMKYRNASAEAIEERLMELDQEWDLDHAIEASAASLALSAFALAVMQRKAFLMLPAAALLKPVLRRMGFRKPHEIEAERRVLRNMKSAAPFSRMPAKHLDS